MTCSAQSPSIVTRPLNVINLGLNSFADALTAAQIPVVNCAWQPPAEGDAELGWKLAKSSMVTAMARNGVEFGIRISGLPNQWFVAESPFVKGLYFPGFSPEDAGRTYAPLACFTQAVAALYDTLSAR